ncbi:hypothetical protein ACFQAT_12765 [Undibacterium arcticum]
MKSACEFEHLDALARTMNVAVVILNTAADIEFASPLAYRFLDCTDEAELKDIWVQCIRPQFGHVGKSQLIKFRKLKVELRRAAKTLLFELDVFPVGKNKCSGYLILLSDRTSDNNIEAAFLVASKTRVQDYLYSALIHDMRGPMNVMKITLSLLDDIVEDAGAGIHDALKKHSAVLHEELGRLNHTLQFVLDLNKAPTTDLQKFDLRELLRETESLLRPKTLKQRVNLTLQPLEHQTFVYGNRDRIKQSVLDLAVMALSEMSEHGNLHIQQTINGPNTCILLKADGEEARFGELLDELDSTYLPINMSHHGVGLYMVRQILRSHG